VLILGHRSESGAGEITALPSTFNDSVEMASFQAVKKAVTLSPTVRTLPTGVPNAPLLNLAARASLPAHDDHAHGSGPRSDKPARFVGGVKSTLSGLISKTFVGVYG